jgi:glycosyltransferase involved in cell wall biosynthesis
MKNVGMIVFSYYPSDPRVRREAEALIDEGYSVSVICLKNRQERKHETVNGVRVIRCSIRRSRGSKMSYLIEYGLFSLYAMLKISMLHLLRRFSVVHVHNMPDFLAFCAAMPKLLGAKIVLDLHDPSPEVFMTKYSMSQDAKMIKAMRLIERMSIWFSDHVITPNLAFKDIFVSRGCPETKVSIVMNSPPEQIFNLEDYSSSSDGRGDSNRPWTLMYHGTIVRRHGLDDLLRAVVIARKQVPGIALHVYGDGDEFVDEVGQVAVECLRVLHHDEMSQPV